MPEPSVEARLAHLAAALHEQVDAGRLDAHAARPLFTDLARTVRHFDDGDATAAARAFAHVRRKIVQLRREGRLTYAGFAALPDLDRIAAAMPEPTPPPRDAGVTAP